jgi:hypothetical protein
MKLFPLNEPQWSDYKSGYNRSKTDIVDWIRTLLSKEFSELHWDYLWDELHHQGDVGEASYAVIPYLSEYAKLTETDNWNVWGFPVVVELARKENNNPPIPKELEESYFEAIKHLADTAAAKDSWHSESSGCMSACIALAKGQRHFARAYLEMAAEVTAVEFIKCETGWVPNENR